MMANLFLPQGSEFELIVLETIQVYTKNNDVEIIPTISTFEKKVVWIMPKMASMISK